MTSYTIDAYGRLKTQAHLRMLAPGPTAAPRSTSSGALNSLGRTVTTHFTDSSMKLSLAEALHQSQKTEESESLLKFKLQALYNLVDENLRVLSGDSYVNTDVSSIILNEFLINLEFHLNESKIKNKLSLVNSLWNNFLALIVDSLQSKNLINYIFNQLRYTLIATHPTKRLIAESFLESFLKHVLINNNTFNTLHISIALDFLLGNYENVEKYFKIATEKEKDSHAALFFAAAYFNRIVTGDKYANMEIEEISNEIMFFPGYLNFKGLSHQFQALTWIIKGSHKNYASNFFVNRLSNSEKVEVSTIEEAVQLVCLGRRQFQEHGIVRVSHARLYLNALYNPALPHPVPPPAPSTHTTLQPQAVASIPQRLIPANEATFSDLILRYSATLAEKRSLVVAKTLTTVGKSFVADLLTLLNTTTPESFRDFWKQIAYHLGQRSMGIHTAIVSEWAHQIAHIEAVTLKATYTSPKNVHFIYLLSFIKEFGLIFMTHFYANVPTDILQAFWKEDWAEASLLCQKYPETNITLFQIGVIAEQKRRKKWNFSGREMEEIINFFSFSQTIASDIREKLIIILCPFEKYMEKIGKGTQELIHDKYELFTCYRENIQKGFTDNRIFLHPILYPEFIRKIIKFDPLNEEIAAECRSLIAHFPFIHAKRRVEDSPFTSNKRIENDAAFQQQNQS